LEKRVTSILERDELLNDAQSTGGSVGDHLWLADRVGILPSDVQALWKVETITWEGTEGKRLRHRIERCLDAIESGDKNQSEVAYRLRLYFETLMLWRVASKIDVDGGGIDLHRLEAIQKRMLWLAEEDQFDASVAHMCWQLDGDFHREVCEMSGRSSLARVVDIVQRRFELLGPPADSDDIRKTWREHGAILKALRSKDREKIFAAENNHLATAFAGTHAKEGNKMELSQLIAQAVDDLRRQIDNSDCFLEMALTEAITWSNEASKRQISLAACDRIRESLVSQFLYPDRYVGYVDVEERDAELVRINRKTLFNTSNAEEAFEMAVEFRRLYPSLTITYQRPANRAQLSTV